MKPIRSYSETPLKFIYMIRFNDVVTIEFDWINRFKKFFWIGFNQVKSDLIIFSYNRCFLLRIFDSLRCYCPLVKLSENNLIQTNFKHSKLIQKTFWISLDANRSKINPIQSEWIQGQNNSDWVGLIFNQFVSNETRNIFCIDSQ